MNNHLIQKFEMKITEPTANLVRRTEAIVLRMYQVRMEMPRVYDLVEVRERGSSIGGTLRPKTIHL